MPQSAAPENILARGNMKGGVRIEWKPRGETRTPLRFLDGPTAERVLSSTRRRGLAFTPKWDRWDRGTGLWSDSAGCGVGKRPWSRWYIHPGTFLPSW